MFRFLASAAALALTIASPCYAKDKAPSMSFDPYRKTGMLTGQSHWHNALLDLDKWQWYFQMAIVNGEARNPVLVFSADVEDWHFFNKAADIDGQELHVIQGDRSLLGLGSGVSETVAVEVTPDYIRRHRSTGMNIKIMGSRGDKVVIIPADAVEAFANGAIIEFTKLAAIR